MTEVLTEEKMEETTVFGSLKELGDLAESLDVCKRQPSVYLDPHTQKYEVDESRMDIVNLRSADRSAVVSNYYKEYQHKDVINHLSGTLNKAQLQAHGTLYNYGDRIRVNLFFDNVKGIRDPTNPDDTDKLNPRGITIGARFKNSYNKQNSVTGSGFFMRVACTNGMVVRNMIPELSFSERHTKSIVTELPMSIQRFTDNLLARAKFVGEAIELAAQTRVKFSTREQRLQTIVAMVEHSKVGELIEAQLTSLEPTKWDIYNAVTYVTSHERMGETVRDRVENFSERILRKSYTIVPAVVV